MPHGYPSNPIIEQAIIDVIYLRGGNEHQIRLINLYEILADHFNLTPEQRQSTSIQITGTGEDRSYWENLVRTAKARLTDKGVLAYGLGYGICKIQQTEAVSPNVRKEHRIKTTIQTDLDSIQAENEYFEGTKNHRFSVYYERDPKLRAEAVLFHGLICKVCDFDFEKFYGEHGAEYIEVHHLMPISSLSEQTSVNPQTDMTVVCSNCHRMIHRKKDHVLSLEELKAMIQKTR